MLSRICSVAYYVWFISLGDYVSLDFGEPSRERILVTCCLRQLVIDEKNNTPNNAEPTFK